MAEEQSKPPEQPAAASRPLRPQPLQRKPTVPRPQARNSSAVVEAAAIAVVVAVVEAAVVAVNAAAVNAVVVAADAIAIATNPAWNPPSFAYIAAPRSSKAVVRSASPAASSSPVTIAKGNLVGIGYGKANEVPMAVEKATKDARKSLVKVVLKGTTIPHQVKGTSGASFTVILRYRPVRARGVTHAGKSVRPCVELAWHHRHPHQAAYGSTSPEEPCEGNHGRSCPTPGPRAGRKQSRREPRKGRRRTGDGLELFRLRIMADRIRIETVP